MNNVKFYVKFFIESKRFEWCMIRDLVSECITDHKILKNVIASMAWSVFQILWLVAVPFFAIWYATADSEKKKEMWADMLTNIDESQNQYGTVCNWEEES